MTTFTGFRSANRDRQDATERGVWGAQTYLPGAGSYMSVRGTGTLDEELPVINTGFGFNLPADSNAEVVMISMGADVNDKYALPTIPRDKQFAWPEGHGGVQSPVDPERRIEFGASDMWLRDGAYAFGPDREQTITVSGGVVTVALSGGQTVTIGGDNSITVSGAMTLTVAGALTIAAQDIDFQSVSLRHNGKDIGENHRHGGVMSGGSVTDEPI